MTWNSVDAIENAPGLPLPRPQLPMLQYPIPCRHCCMPLKVANGATMVSGRCCSLDPEVFSGYGMMPHGHLDHSSSGNLSSTGYGCKRTDYPQRVKMKLLGESCCCRVMSALVAQVDTCNFICLSELCLLSICQFSATKGHWRS